MANMAFFEFSPGDGILYRLLFAEIPAQGPAHIPYTYIAIAEGYAEPLLGYPFDNRRISFDTFTRHIPHPQEHVQLTAYRVWLVLTGTGERAEALDDPLFDTWHADWRDQLPMV